VHTAPQTSGVAAGHTQAPASQLATAGHARPHRPQFSGSTRRSVQVAPHASGVAAGHAQDPSEQAAPAGHSARHLPQFFAFGLVSTQSPADLEARLP
jgi:hypothetical protein